MSSYKIYLDVVSAVPEPDQHRLLMMPVQMPMFARLLSISAVPIVGTPLDILFQMIHSVSSIDTDNLISKEDMLVYLNQFSSQ